MQMLFSHSAQKHRPILSDWNGGAAIREKRTLFTPGEEHAFDSKEHLND